MHINLISNNNANIFDVISITFKFYNYKREQKESQEILYIKLLITKLVVMKLKLLKIYRFANTEKGIGFI